MQQCAHALPSLTELAHTESLFFPLHWHDMPLIQKFIEYPALSQHALHASEFANCDAHTVPPPLSGMLPHVHLPSLIELESWKPPFRQHDEHSALKEKLVASAMCAQTSRLTEPGTCGVPVSPASDAAGAGAESEPHAPSKTTTSQLHESALREFMASILRATAGGR